MSLNAVQSAVFKRLKAAPPSSLPIAYPNVAGQLPTTDYLRVNILPADTQTVGLQDFDIERGIVQIDVMTSVGIGALKAGEYAAAVLALFPRGTTLTEAGEAVKFDVRGSVAPALQDGSWYQVPVSIPYLILR